MKSIASKVLVLSAGFAAVGCTKEATESAGDAQGFRTKETIGQDTTYKMSFFVPTFVDKSTRIGDDALLYCAYELSVSGKEYSPEVPEAGEIAATLFHGDNENQLFAAKARAMDLGVAALTNRLPKNASATNPVVSGVKLSMVQNIGQFAITNSGLKAAAGNIKRVLNSLKAKTEAEQKFANEFVEKTLPQDLERIINTFNKTNKEKGADALADAGLVAAGWESIIKHTDVKAAGSENAGVSTFELIMSIAGAQQGRLGPQKAFTCPGAEKLRDRLNVERFK
jgi:hypothetical protein